MVDIFTDRFNRADDATGLGDNWDVELGNLQIIANAAIQQAGAGFAETARALALETLDLAQQRAAIFAEIGGVSGDPWVEVLSRFVEGTVTSPTSTDSGYAVRLLRQSTGERLSIMKYEDGVATEKAGGEIVLGSPADRIVPIQISTQNVKDGVEVCAFYDDLENPLLRYTDIKHPIWEQIGAVGFQVFEGSGETSPQTVIHRFESAILDVLWDESMEEEPLAWNAEKIVQHIRFNVDQDGSLSELEAADVLDFLNLVEAQFVLDVGPVEWLEGIFEVRVPAGRRYIRMPRQVSDEIIDVYDYTNKVMLAHRNRHDMNTRYRNREGSSGQPQVWMKVGRAAGDLIQLELYPVPSGEVILHVFARGRPGVMEFADYPMIPMDFVDALIQGTIVKAGAAKGNEKLLRIASATYSRAVTRARAKDRRSRDIHVVPFRSLPRKSRPPVSRLTQRGFPYPFP